MNRIRRDRDGFELSRENILTGFSDIFMMIIPHDASYRTDAADVLVLS